MQHWFRCQARRCLGEKLDNKKSPHPTASAACGRTSRCPTLTVAPLLEMAGDGRLFLAGAGEEGEITISGNTNGRADHLVPKALSNAWKQHLNASCSTGNRGREGRIIKCGVPNGASLRLIA